MSKKNIDLAKKLLRRGELVIFPTETVYGLGGDATNDKAIKLIYKVKKRPKNNPLICHFSNLKEIEKYFYLSDIEKIIAKKFWPGPLTLILKKRENNKLSKYLSHNSNYVGCRIPKNKIARKLITINNNPIAAPSANLSQRTSITNIKDIDPVLSKKVFILKSTQSSYGLESTVIKINKRDNIEILRFGSISVEELNKISIITKVKVIKRSSLSPGNMSKHYSTKKPIRMNVKEVFDNEGLLNFGNIKLKSKIINLNLSKKGNLNEAAVNFYHYLHKLDKSKCNRIAVVNIPNDGLGKTINDRLKRAIK